MAQAAGLTGLPFSGDSSTCLDGVGGWASCAGANRVPFSYSEVAPNVPTCPAANCPNPANAHQAPQILASTWVESIASSTVPPPAGMGLNLRHVFQCWTVKQLSNDPAKSESDGLRWHGAGAALWADMDAEH